MLAKTSRTADSASPLRSTPVIMIRKFRNGKQERPIEAILAIICFDCDGFEESRVSTGRTVPYPGSTRTNVSGIGRTRIPPPRSWISGFSGRSGCSVCAGRAGPVEIESKTVRREAGRDHRKHKGASTVGGSSSYSSFQGRNPEDVLRTISSELDSHGHGGGHEARSRRYRASRPGSSRVPESR
jgi:hypothetical protein